jgi:hypothetical protein
LSFHFQDKGVSLHAPLIKKTAGGIVNWRDLKKQIENHLKHEPSAIVSTLIDFYGIHAKHKFPAFGDIAKDNATKLDNMQKGMLRDIQNNLQYRFIPYIQLHEFEALVFCSLDVLKANFAPAEADFVALETIMNTFSNPEDINNSRETAPSKRLEKHIKGYHKITYGVGLTQSIGLVTLRQKCPRFNAWIQSLESI